MAKIPVNPVQDPTTTAQDVPAVGIDTSTPTAAIIASTATEPEVSHTPRTTLPAVPRLIGEAEQAIITRIRAASLWATHLAIQEVSSIPTMNKHPAIAIYKTEMLEYLNSKLV